MLFLSKQTSKINGSKQNSAAKHYNHMAAHYILNASVSFTGGSFKNSKVHTEKD